MTRYFLLVALLVVAMVSPASAGLDHIPNGLVIGAYPAEASADVTPGDNDLHVVGTVEVNGAARFDGAVTMTSTLAITGGVTYTGAAVFDSNVTITDDDLIFGDGDELGFSWDAAANVARLRGSSDQDNERDTNIMTCTTAVVTIVSTILDVSDVELATISSRAGDLSMTVSDTSGNVAFAGVIDVGDIEAATLSARDGALALTLSDSTGNVAAAGVIDVSDVEQATASARDGALALTFTDSTGVVAFAATPTGTDLDFSGTLECDILEADTIVNEAGTGAPAATFGFTVGANIVTDTDGNDEVGTFAATFAAMCATEIDCSTIGDSVDGTDAIAIDDNGVCTFQQKIALGASAAVTKWVWYGFHAIEAAAANPAAAATTGSNNVWQFRDETQDEYVWTEWKIPDDCDASADAEMYYVYTMSEDVHNGYVAGVWQAMVDNISDGTAVAAAATALEDVTDTPQAGATWNFTTGATIPNANIVSGGVLNIAINHDAGAASANEPQLAGVWIAYSATTLGQ